MFWHLPGYTFGGAIMGRFDGRYHLFTTKKPRDGDLTDVKVHHAVSDDLLTWEDWPDCIGVGPQGEFDGWTVYDLHVIEHDGRYYMYYTGLDRPHGPGQQQATGLAVSDDLRTWTRYADKPVLTAPPRYYEPAVPPEATYQDKDGGRQWFRDPFVVRDPDTGTWRMAVGARDAAAEPDVRGCIAWAESDDLVTWKALPPVYSPGRFHTLECPVLLEQNGRWYLIYLTHHGWGTPFRTTDPYQTAGGFYAVSDNGVDGPYESPDDEVLVGGTYVKNKGFAYHAARAAVVRAVADGRGGYWGHYHFAVGPAAGDDPSASKWSHLAEVGTVMNWPKPLHFTRDGRMHLAYSPLLDTLTEEAAPPFETATPVEGFETVSGGFRGKDFREPIVQPAATAGPDDGVFRVRVRFLRGLRAGLVLRGDDAGNGLAVVLDRQMGCIEIKLLGTDGWIDRRRYDVPEQAELTVAFIGPSIEVYCDGRLMLHQARYSPAAGRLGLLVDRAEAVFDDLTVRQL